MNHKSTIQEMFDKIAFRYDFFNNIISFYMHKKVKKIALKNLPLKNNSRVLDLCCGSGDLGRIIKHLAPGCEVIGVDFSHAMLDIAKSKNPDIKYIYGDAENLEFDDKYFDIVVMGFGLRNIENKDKALREIYRVLKDRGCFLHLDFGEKSIFSKIYDKIVLFLITYFTQNTKPYEYLINSKNEFLTPSELLEKCKNVGFEYVKHKNLLFNIISFQIVQKK